ncbi:CAP domain-containing protein [Frigidibacter sp. RF13]|uniref:CAP domain-containing protein n=1 Tax=Frigidibacter sp. RF13 TaxID=2997340 RepID=UPI00226DDAFD|nr:CAP domain-containing protein [Frigidibacter sp. RF13]MCY1126450.1 CAP domain-containing protein [Frigidibacter sp. RF13]
MSKANTFELQMFQLINGERAAIGLSPLTLNDRLNDSAETHRRSILYSDVFSHTGVDGSSPQDRMEGAGYRFEGSWRSGENIAFQSERGQPGLSDDVIDLHRGLMNSPGHRANILNPEFKEIGIGLEQGDFTSEGTTFDSVVVTQNFATSDAPNGAPEEPPAPDGDMIAEAPDISPAPDGSDTGSPGGTPETDLPVPDGAVPDEDVTARTPHSDPMPDHCDDTDQPDEEVVVATGEAPNVDDGCDGLPAGDDRTGVTDDGGAPIATGNVVDHAQLLADLLKRGYGDGQADDPDTFSFRHDPVQPGADADGWQPEMTPWAADPAVPSELAAARFDVDMFLQQLAVTYHGGWQPHHPCHEVA